jgi:hypothetical protein
LGFELIEDRTARTISAIKKAIMESVRKNSGKKIKLSVLVAEVINKDYSSLSNLFSSVEGITIEQLAILQKIEFVKELLVYDEAARSYIILSQNSLHLSPRDCRIFIWLSFRL